VGTRSHRSRPGRGVISAPFARRGGGGAPPVATRALDLDAIDEDHVEL